MSNRAEKIVVGLLEAIADDILADSRQPISNIARKAIAPFGLNGYSLEFAQFSEDRKSISFRGRVDVGGEHVPEGRITATEFRADVNGVASEVNGKWAIQNYRIVASTHMRFEPSPDDNSTVQP